MASWRDLRNSTRPQRLFLDALTAQGQYEGVSAPKVLYGGAGFGGKSYGIRTAAVEICGVLKSLGYTKPQGAIFCKTYPDLAARQVGKLRTEFERDLGIGEVVDSKVDGLMFRFHDEQMGLFYLRNADSPDKYRGAEYDFILVDELTEWLRDEYDLILYPLRSGRSSGIPFLSFGGASNPDGRGHGWVKKLWIEKNYEGEPPGIVPDQYIFIPAKATDNPAYNENVENTLTSFRDPMLVKARRHGSWDLASGTRFGLYSKLIHGFEWQDFENEYGIDMGYEAILARREMFNVIASLDYGTDIHSASAFYVHVYDWKGRIWTVKEEYMQGMFLKQQSAIIKRACEEWGVSKVFCDPSLLGRDSDGISRLMKFRRNGVNMLPAVNDRVEGWATLDDALQYGWDEKTGEVNTPPKWRIHNSCWELHQFLANAPRDDARPEDVSSKFRRDHAGDAARYGLHSYSRGPMMTKEEYERAMHNYQ